MGWGDIAAALVTLAGGALTSWLVARILPLGHIPKQTTEFVALSEKYGRWELQLMVVWLLVLLPAASFGVWRLLIRVANARHARLGRSEVAFFPGVVEWGLIAVFLAAVVSIALLWLGVRIHLGPRYAEYRRYETLRWGIGTWIPWLSMIVMSAVLLLLTAELLDWYAVFSADGIRIDNLFSASERTYRYEDVRGIRTAPKWVAPIGSEVERREYVFCFQDGSSWSTQSPPGGVSLQNRRRLAEFVAAKSKTPVRELPVLTRKDQSCQ